MSEIAGQVAIITGGARGIGRGIALELGHAGVDVVIGDLLTVPEIATDAAETVAMLEAMGRRAAAVHCDVRSEEDLAELVAKAVNGFGRLDIVCPNAGICNLSPVGELSVEEFRRTFDINTLGMFLTVRSALPTLLAQGRGSIVATASITGLKGTKELVHYAASKAAVISMVQSLALELGPSGIRVNCILPGTVFTGISAAQMDKHGVPDEMKEQILDQVSAGTTPLGRMQTPADMGQAVVYLCQADNVTGTSINVSGGAAL